MADGLRNTGIQAIGDAPWGTHFCQFYQTKEDLIEILVPYFKAGLENNEFCMWVTAEPLGVKEAKASLKKAVPNLNDYVKKGQIQILDADQWYTKSGKFDSDAVLQGWVKKENQALKKGFAGLRLTGNTFWLEKRDWRNFAEYEEQVNRVIGKHRILALCSYSLDKCGASEIIDVVQNHQFALIRREGDWELIESSERMLAEEALKAEKEFTETALNAQTDTFFVFEPSTGRAVRWNKAFNRISGYSDEEIRSMKAPDSYYNEKDLKKAAAATEKVLNEETATVELSLITKDGRSIPTEYTGSAIKDNEGNPKYIIAVGRNITERKQAEDRLRESEKRYREFTDSLPQIVFETDAEGNLTFVNLHALGNYGYSREDLDKGLNVLQLVIPEDRERVKKGIVRGFSGEELAGEEYTALRKDGSTFPIVAHSKPIIRGNRVVGLRGIVVDISERKRSEERFVETNKLLETLLDHTHMLVAYLDPQFNFLKVNRAYADADKRDPSFFPGKNHFDLYPDAENEQIFRRVVKTGEPYFAQAKPFEYAEHPERGVSYWDWSLIPIKDPMGAVAGLVLTLVDVTERERAEKALRESEERLRSFMDSATDAFVLWDKELNLVEANEAAVKTFAPGARMTEMIGKNILELVPTLKKTGRHERYLEVIRTAKPFHVDDVILDPKFGERRVAVTAFKVGDGLGMVVTDITERKQVEEGLEWELAVNKELAKLSGALIIRFSSVPDIANIVLDSAKSLTDSQHGYVSSIDPKTGDNVGHTLTRMMEDQCLVSDECRRISFSKAPDGSYPGLGGHALNSREGFFTNSPETHKASRGVPVGHIPLRNFLSVPAMIGEELVGQIALANSTRDYTDRDLTGVKRLAEMYAMAIRHKWAEEAREKALKESQLRQAEISSLLGASSAVLEYREFPGAARAIFNSCKSLIGATAGYVALFSTDGRENEVVFLDSGGLPCTVDPSLPMPIRGLREEAYRSGKVVYHNDFSKSEWVRYMPPGHAALENVLFTPLIIRRKAVGLLGLANKPGGFTQNDARIASAFAELSAVALSNSRMFESLEKSEERFRSVAQTASDAIITVDSTGSIVFWNLAAEAMFGYSPDEAMRKPLTLIMPERFHEAQKRGMKRVVSGGEAKVIGKTVEMAGLRKDRSEFPLELSIATWKTGEEIFFTGILRDITGRKRAEEALRESEEKFRSLAEQSPNMIFINNKGRVVYANQRCTEIMGYKREEFYSSDFNFAELIAPEFRERINKAFKGHMAGEEQHPYEYTLITKEGKKIEAILNSKLIAYGGEAAILGIVTDITERKQAEQALRESEQRFRVLFEQAADSVVLVDPETQALVDFNDLAHRNLGFTREEFRGLRVQDLEVVESPDEVKRHAERISRTGEDTFETRLKAKDGEIHDFLMKIRSVSTGGKDYLLGLWHDITERKRAEQEIQKLNESLKAQAAELAAANRELEAFSYSVSHDLRAPLRTTDGFSRALLEDYPDKLDERGKDYLRRIRAATQRMGELVDDLLNLSMMMRKEMRREQIDLSEVAHSIAEELKKTQPERQVEFVIQDGVLAHGDARLLRDVLENLLRNAWKFTSKHPQGRIEFGVTHKDGETAYFVRDDGAGFDMNYAEKLFVPFQRLHSVGEFSGNGVGLAVVTRIINRHGGRVWAEGEVEKGATFFFTLP